MRERGREGAKGKSINSVQPSTARARARKCTLLVKQLTQGTARGHFRHRTDRGEGGGLGLDGTRVAERKISKGQTFSPSPLKVRIESERASERAIAIEGRRREGQSTRAVDRPVRSGVGAGTLAHSLVTVTVVVCLSGGGKGVLC